MDQTLILKKPEGEQKDDDQPPNPMNGNNSSDNNSDNSNDYDKTNDNNKDDSNEDEKRKDDDKDKSGLTNGTIMKVPPLLEENIPITTSQCISKVWRLTCLAGKGVYRCKGRVTNRSENSEKQGFTTSVKMVHKLP